MPESRQSLRPPPGSYPQVRSNPLTGDRVIVAPARADRPQESPLEAEAGRVAGRRSDCPFCPGNEDETPREILRIPEDRDAGDWRVRVVANKYPALVADPGGAAASITPGGQLEPAVGRHEVVIETPEHDRSFSDLTDEELFEVFSAYRSRFAAAAADARIRHVVIFRNQGKLANATLEHPHSQIAAMAFVPPALAGRVDRARAHFRRHGRALLIEMAAAELAEGTRVIESNGNFVAFVPFAPSHEGEVWIAPLQIPPRFDAVDDELLLDFGRALRGAVTALERTDYASAYNLVVQTPPLGVGTGADLVWYGQLLPRRSLAAGFELGVGVHILVTPPEESARALRNAGR